ncbi:MAG: 1-(5-phosphoribosyl)-5-[(5-phosphoribosylamino)methylideneamino]imidazole-4-carboxamide isomerase [Dysgonamonadaceae bacterium]|jgi:phosphoribosylformimino-5-aminoimidazole carboxamide ribotide isomerase|nr:1-(5-phosphoribosyl)-5-[(5-phosphoribosylamino)methylideneamino]imidazole-4-carboxamide isomerase [Dysgonamonadaceae bacterium]
MIEIIPALDILEGKAVRLSQGNYEQKTVYNEDPLEVAKQFEDHGVHRLHVVDLDGAKANRIINYKTLEKIASRTSLIIDFGGGLKSDSDLEIAFNSGAAMITGGSIAVREPDVFQRWIDKFGSQSIILGADCRNNKISVTGWTEDTEHEVAPFILHWRKQGINKVICTDIGKDGMLEGPNIELYKQIKEQDSFVYLIASGGISGMQDIERLETERIPAVIIGKALYEGQIKMKDLLPYIENRD